MISIPILYLDNTVLYPGTRLIARFTDKKSIHVINYCIQNDLPVLILLYPKLGHNHEFGTLAKFHDIIPNSPSAATSNLEELKITLEGVSRARVNNIVQHIPCTIGEIEFKRETQGSSLFTENDITKLKTLIKSWAMEEVKNSNEREEFLSCLDNFTKIINYACFLLINDPEVQQFLLETNTISKRFQLLSNILIEKREKYDQAEFINALKNFNDTQKTNISH